MFDSRHNPLNGRSTAGVSIRWTDSDDNRFLANVATRDSQELPEGPWLVAEVEGMALAVLSLSSGAYVADPFSRTTELRALLELRAKQLGERRSRRRRLFSGTRAHATGGHVALASRPRF
jgi:hypothetical protein